MGAEFRWGWNLGRGGVWAGMGPRLRTCMEGERQHVQRRASGVWSSGVSHPFFFRGESWVRGDSL